MLAHCPVLKKNASEKRARPRIGDAAWTCEIKKSENNIDANFQADECDAELFDAYVILEKRSECRGREHRCDVLSRNHFDEIAEGRYLWGFGQRRWQWRRERCLMLSFGRRSGSPVVDIIWTKPGFAIKDDIIRARYATGVVFSNEAD
jgi:hypothetical protein